MIDKVIIPAAGQGTRLKPHTHTKPKPMIRLAGKPIIGHIIEGLKEIKPKEIIVVVGYKKEELINYLDRAFPKLNITYVEQEKQLGLGHSIYVTKEHVDGSCMILLGDMLFENSYKKFIEKHRENGTAQGSIGVKIVDDPRFYGIVTIDENGYIKHMVEKPKKSRSRLGISGVYIFEETEPLFDALTHIVERNIKGSGNEFQLTDALQHMVKNGFKMKTFHVGEWYDCGRPETILEANRVLLSKSGGRRPSSTNSVIIEPVDIPENVIIENSIIGPYVSIDENSTIRNSIIKDSIIGRESTIENMNMERSIIGDEANLTGKNKTLNLGDNSTLVF